MRAAKVDDNQKEIVKALRTLGCSVQHLHSVGAGCPDLLVGYKGFNILLELKDGNKSPSQQKLTPDQIIWHRDWRGHVNVVNSSGQAILAVLTTARDLSDLDDLK
jgi:Holliday junction resolvase